MRLAVLFSLLLMCLLIRHDKAQASAPSALQVSSLSTSLTDDAVKADGPVFRSKSGKAAETLNVASDVEDSEDEEATIKKHSEQARYLYALTCAFFLPHCKAAPPAPLPPAGDLSGSPSSLYIAQRVLRI